MTAPFRLPGGGGGGGARDLMPGQMGGGANAITLQQAEEQARVARRVNLLEKELPGLAYNNESILHELAAGFDDDADMMQAAIDSMSIADQELMLEELKTMPEDQQRGLYKSMNPTKRKALEEMGWSPPPEERGGFGGFMDRLMPGGAKDALMMGFNPLGAGFKALPEKAKPTTWAAAGVAKATQLPGISHVLGGMNYIAEEVSRTQRVLPQMQSGQRVLDETGLTPDQLFERTGIRTTGAAGNPLVEGEAGAIGTILGLGNQNPLEWVKNPSDIWRAAQTWNAIGHEGSDDILPEVQMEVFSALEDEFGSDQAKDMLRWAKGIAAGHSVQELAEMDGLEGDAASRFVAQVSSLAAAPQFKQQVARLTTGQMSAGRTLARSIWNDPMKDVSTEGAARYVSGGFDAVWAVAADPTIVAGKLTKTVKATKWALKSGDKVDDLSRFQEMVAAVSKADEGVEGFNLADELAKIAEKHGTKARSSALAKVMDAWSPTTAEAQARAVAAPAQAAAEAFRTGDFGKLTRQYPGFEKSIADMKRYDAALTTMQREAGQEAVGLRKAENVFEFYKHAAWNKSVLNTVDDTTNIQVLNQRLFGRDGGGHVIVPHMTNPQRKLMSARESFRNWRYNLEEGTATFPVRKQALEDLKASADEAHQSMVDEGLAEPFDPADWVVDSETFTYQRKPPTGVKKLINQMVEVVTTPTTRGAYVPVTDDVATSAQEFRAFNETLGMLSGDDIVTRRVRYNRFVNGTIQERHALINQMLNDMASATGLNATEEGQTFIRRFVEHSNQVYGELDRVAVANGQSLTSAIVKQGIFENQAAQALTVPSMREMMIATRNANMLRWVSGTTRKSWLEAGMTRVWKPAQLMRLGFPLRAGADEALQFIGRVSLSDYLDKAVFQKWAGVTDQNGKLVRHLESGTVLAPQGAVKPIRSFTRSWATIWGVTNDALDDSARQIAARNPEWFKAGADQKALLEAARNEAAGNLKALPKAVRFIDQLAHDAALKSTDWYHQTAIGGYVTRQKFAEGVLKARGKYVERIEANQLMYLHPIAQQGAMETAGNTFVGFRPGSDDPLIGVGMLAFDKDSPTKFQYLKVTTNSKEWEWVGHNDLTGFYLNLDHWMRSANQNSPAFRAIADEMLHHVPQSVVDDLARFGDNGMDVLVGFRNSLDEADSEIASMFRLGADNDASAATIRQVLDERELTTSPEIDDLLANWDDLSPKSKLLVTDPQLYTPKLTTDFRTVEARAANAGHAAMRRLDQAENQRKLVRAQMVNGRPVAAPLKEGHTRVYGVMVDRRNAEDLMRLFQDENMMETFAQRVSEHLGSANLRKHMKTVWDAGLPTSEGYDFATWMAGMKANIAQGSGSYIPAMMTGTSNPAVAQAIRDAIADVMPEQVLRPTIGFLDHPDDLFTTGFGMEKLDDSVVWMSPNQASTMQFIDPDSQVKLVKVEHEGQTMWVGEDEVEGLFGKKARIDSTPIRNVWQSKSMIGWNGKEVVLNRKLIDQDFADGMKFLRGEGGEMARRGSVYKWDDPADASFAQQMAELLDGYGLTDRTGLDFDSLIGAYKARNFRTGPLPLEDVLRDNDVWDDFEELARSATTKGKRDVETWFDEQTAVDSKIVKAALDRLGVQVDELGLTAGEYRSLLVARQQAHAALAPTGFRAAKSVSPEAIEREMDALAIAFQKTGIDLGDEIAERVNLAVGSETADYKILGTIWGNGVTEDVAMRRTAQDQLNEAMGMFVGRQSGEVLHEILSPLRRGSHTQQNLWNRVKLDDLPTKSFGPMRVAAHDTRWDRLVRRTFDGAWDPTIVAISRTPMFSDAFHKSLDRYRVVHQNTLIKSLDDGARSMLAAKGFDPEALRDVNRIIGSQLKANPELGKDLGDAYVDYLKAVQAGNADEATRNLARIAAGDGATDEAISEAAERLALSEDELDLLKRWHANHTNAVDAWVHRSTQHAIEMVTPFIDDHRIRSALNEYLGPVAVPYLYAEEQFLRRVARGFYETPHMLRKAQLTMNGLRNIGVVKDEPHGTMFIIPGSELLMGVVADAAEAITGNPAMQVLDQPLQMRADYVLPGWSTSQSRWGWGPIVGLSIDSLTHRYPEYEFRKDDPNRPWWSYVVPGPASGFYKAFLDEADPTQMASAQVAAMSYLEANGHGLPENATASQTDDYIENVNQVAKTIASIRYITGQLGFTAAQPVDVSAVMRQEFTDLLNTGLDYGEAVDRFIEEHGPEAMVYTVFGTTNETGAPLFSTTTEEALQWMLDNETLVQDNPTAMAWLLPQGDEKSKFDRRAYNQQLALGLRTRKSPQEMLDAVRAKEAAEDYWDANETYRVERNLLVEQRDASRGNQKDMLQEQINLLDDQWSTWKEGYMKQHPTFAESLNPDAHERRQKALEQLNWLLETGVGGEQAEVIKPMVDAYWAFTAEYQAWSDQNSKVAKQIKADMLKDYFDEQWLYVKQNPKAAPFWNSVIRPELPDAADPLVRESQSLGGA